MSKLLFAGAETGPPTSAPLALLFTPNLKLTTLSRQLTPEILRRSRAPCRARSSA